MTEFFSQRQIKATRKVHTCDSCQKQIDVGSHAGYYAGLSEGDFYSLHYHVECRAAELACNNALGLSGDEWLSLWACLDNSVVDTEEAEACAMMLRTEHPIVAARVLK